MERHDLGTDFSIDREGLRVLIEGRQTPQV